MFLGCDTDALRAIADRMEASGHATAEAAAAIERAIETVPWDGVDAEAFRADVRAGLVVALGRIAETWQMLAAEGRAQSREQDEASAPDPAPMPGATLPLLPPGPGVPPVPVRAPSPDATLRERLRAWLDRVLPLDEGPSRGLFSDVLGPEHGPRAEEAWADVSVHAGRASGGIGPLGTVEAIAVDEVNKRIGSYEVTQGVRDGDGAVAMDGVLTGRLANADQLFAALELTPLAPLGVAGSTVTGRANEVWWGLRSDARAEEAEGGESRGSATRYVLQAPRRALEDHVRPFVERVPGPAGDVGSLATEGLISAHRAGERTSDETHRAASEALREVPGVDEALSMPRRLAESPRHSVERIRDRV